MKMNEKMKQNLVEGLAVAGSTFLATIIANCLVNKSMDLIGKAKNYLTEKTPKESYEDLFED